MAGEVEVRGGVEMAALAKRLKQAGNGRELRKEFLRSLREATKPVVGEQRRRVKGIKGAPREWRDDAARSTKAKNRTSGLNAGVRISAGSGATARYAKRMNRGGWRHPTFGHDPWRAQKVPQGWFDEPAERAKAEVQRKVFAAIERTVEQLAE